MEIKRNPLNQAATSPHKGGRTRRGHLFDHPKLQREKPSKTKVQKTDPLTKNKSNQTVFVVFLFTILTLACKISNPTLWLSIGLLCSNRLAAQHVPLRNKASRHILHLSIQMMGFSIPIAKVAMVGFRSFPLTLISVSITMLVGIMLYRKLGVDRTLGFLLTTGTTICGGSAIAAVSGAIDADHQSIAKSTLIVFLLNAIALVVFPVLGRWLEMTPIQFGQWAALAIHDTSSVVGAAASFGQESLDTAILIKLTRSLWILPLTIIANFTRTKQLRAVRIPWFICGFILNASVASLLPAFDTLWQVLASTGKPLFALALFLIGTQMNLCTLKRSMNRELLMASLLWVFTSSASATAILKGWTLL